MMTEKLWAGKRLGLPEQGPGSLAKVPRRVIGLCIDWGISLLISAGLFAGDNLATLVAFGLMQWLMVATLGASFGHMVCRMRVLRLGHPYVGFRAAFLRVSMILLIIPAIVWDNDNRGLHDKLAGTALVLR